MNPLTIHSHPPFINVSLLYHQKDTTIAGVETIFPFLNVQLSYSTLFRLRCIFDLYIP